jgi:hypothetical protein
MVGKQKRIKGPAIKPPLLGTQRMRSAARKRRATWIHEDTWRVDGGENEHTVIAGQYNKPETFTCDCGVESKRKVCCHILAVMMEM